MSEGKEIENTKPKKITHDSWNWIGELGEGAYSTVMEAEMIEESSPFYGKRFAIKVVDKKNIIRNRKQKYVKIEKRVFLKCNHPNILKLRFTFQDESSLYFVMDLCDGELFRLVREREKLPLNLTQLYVAEILSALEHMHENEIVHRDLKPENILIKHDGHIALTDFGTCRILSDDEKGDQSPVKPIKKRHIKPKIDSIQDDSDDERIERAKSFVGTAEYVAPELLSSQVDNLYGLDFWGLGCVIYTCLVGHPPFKGRSEYLTFQEILNSNLEFPKHMHRDAKDIISGLLDRNPTKRYGVRGGFRKLKTHPFFRGLDFNKLNDTEVPNLPPISTIVARSPSEKRWLKFLVRPESIVHGGEIEKPHRVFKSKRRTLLLTDTPRFIFIDHDKMQETKDILWSKHVKVELTGADNFKLTTSKKVYTLKAITGTAREWKVAIEKMLKKKDSFSGNNKLSLE